MATNELNLKHIAVDNLRGQTSAVLREVVAEAATLAAAAQEEMQRQIDAIASDLDASKRGTVASDKPAAKKRGPKSNAEKAAEAAAANGHAPADEEDQEVTLS
jgi:hypothetical protein